MQNLPTYHFERNLKSICFQNCLINNTLSFDIAGNSQKKH